MVSLSRPFIRIVDTDKLCMLQALDFLNVKDKPEDHGITGEDHIKGAQVAHHTFVEKGWKPRTNLPRSTLHLNR